MDAVNAGKPVILQVFNTPAKLVQRQDGNRILYFFEKVFTEELVGSYFIDVVFDMNDENIEAMNDVPRPEPHNPNALEHRISLDGYKIQVYRSEFRATYYLTPTVKRKTNSDVVLLLAVVGIPPVLFLILLLATYAN
ncbi:GSCOCG00010856001-RA-CDS [Cotesia congregata]|nr:GSCOCG00010856001-RA-CDS [Cotesia congregata]